MGTLSGSKPSILRPRMRTQRRPWVDTEWRLEQMVAVFRDLGVDTRVRILQNDVFFGVLWGLRKGREEEGKKRELLWLKAW